MKSKGSPTGSKRKESKPKKTYQGNSKNTKSKNGKKSKNRGQGR